MENEVKLDELINRLQRIQSKEGNIPVRYDMEEQYSIQHILISVDKNNKRALILE